jgi:lysophospholipase L1-like esterase
MARTVVACLGDSITEGSPYWDARLRHGDPRGRWQHWAALAHPGLEFRNHGIWGERTDEIAARFDEAVAGADVLILQGGINDLAQGRSIESAATNLAAMVERAVARGLPAPYATCSRGRTAGPRRKRRSARSTSESARSGCRSFRSTTRSRTRTRRVG